VTGGPAPARCAERVQNTRGRQGLCAALLVLAAWPAMAGAADPGRWRAAGHSRLPLAYYQGITSDPDRRLWFDGVFLGLYRTDDRLRERARRDVAIPPGVTATEGYNHIGDITWDAREGGRVLLPLECYYPGRPGGENACGTGSIGVADPTTLDWRYFVKLDPAEIPKAMWAEVSPDGKLLWTSSGGDLLAYRTADVTLARAAPGAAPLRSVRRLAGAVPPTGITGAAFYGRRLLVAGQASTRFQAWSIDVATGSRRLEIERRIVGESEGLDVIDAFGGVLHWLVTPYNPDGSPPTYGPNGNVLLHFRPAHGRPALRLAARPATVRARRRTRLRLRVTAVQDGRAGPVAGAIVRVRGVEARTSARGVARLTVRFARPGRRRATASRPGMRRATTSLRVVSRPGAACGARVAC
jgi:hypothetical protein